MPIILCRPTEPASDKLADDIAVEDVLCTLTEDELKIREEQETSDMVCRTVYYRGGKIDISQFGTTCYISPTTKSFIACHIYHDITIYKNGQWVTSKRFEDWNTTSLTSSVTVSVSTGDVLDIYVDHYAEHESASSSTQYIAK